MEDLKNKLIRTALYGDQPKLKELCICLHTFLYLDLHIDLVQLKNQLFQGIEPNKVDQ